MSSTKVISDLYATQTHLTGINYFTVLSLVLAVNVCFNIFGLNKHTQGVGMLLGYI